MSLFQSTLSSVAPINQLTRRLHTPFLKQAPLYHIFNRIISKPGDIFDVFWGPTRAAPVANERRAPPFSRPAFLVLEAFPTL